MSKQNHDNKQLNTEEIRERKVKMMEGGIVFALVLSLCVYLGIRFAHEPAGDDVSPVAAITQTDTPAAMPTDLIDDVTAPTGTPSPTDEAPVDQASAEALVVADGTEPAATVEPEISNASGEVPPLEEILPDVPLMVTYSIAEKTFFDGDYTKAAAMFEVYCDAHPQNAWGHYMHGLSLARAGDHEAARGAYNTALGLKPDHLKSLVNLARLELALNEPEAALATIERALDVAPDNADARRVLGRVYHTLDRDLEAAATYVEVLKLRGDDAWTLNNLALVWMDAGDYERALPALARAVELKSDAAVIRNNLAMTLEHTGHLNQALEQYTVAADLGSAKGEASYFRLDGVTMPADDPAADLGVLAAAWIIPGSEVEQAPAVAVDEHQEMEQP
jgi:Flp pilus assembly protein TadD